MQWCRQLFEKPAIRIADRPHLVGADEELFLGELAQAKQYLEYGAGGSTVAAARAGVPTVCIESDQQFADAVNEKICSLNHRVVVHYADIGKTGRWGRPLKLYATPSVRSRYPQYVFAPDRYAPQGFFDLILIDGRFRVACALYVIRRVVEAGTQSVICFDDYQRRAEYHAVESYCKPTEIGEQLAIFRPDKQGLRRVPTDQDITAFCQSSV